MRPTWRSEALPLAFLALTWVLAALYWPQLPSQVPTHWGVDGQPNAWLPMPWGALIGPLISTFMYAVLVALPWLDPRSAHWQSFGRIYGVIRTCMLAFFAYVTYLSLASAARPDHALSVSYLLAGIGLLYLVLGNYLPKVRSNFFLGIRTPWTLSSDEVWDRTHRMAGRMMTVLGLVVLFAGLLPSRWALGLVVGSACLLAIATTGYSYWLFLQLKRA